MAQHGYLREYDEGWDRGEDRDRERSDRDWRDRDRGDREWRRGDHDRDFMFGDHDRERERGSGRDDDRGFFSRMRDDARSIFRDDDDRQYRQTHSQWSEGREGSRGSQRGYEQSAFSNRQDRASSHPDDHYRSWRDQQMQALDRDYADYCREREQQFHREFDSWRQNRQQSQQASQGAQQSAGQDELILGASHAEAGGLAGGTESQAAPSGESQATLGTNNPENSATGRAGRR